MENKQQPEALRLAETWQAKAQREASRQNSAYDVFGMGNTPESVDPLGASMAAELRSLHARVQELEFRRDIASACFRNISTASQAQRVPLSDEQIAEACGWKAELGCKPLPRELRIARAIEAAHGITQEKQG